MKSVNHLLPYLIFVCQSSSVHFDSWQEISSSLCIGHLVEKAWVFIPFSQPHFSWLLPPGNLFHACPFAKILHSPSFGLGILRVLWDPASVPLACKLRCDYMINWKCNHPPTPIQVFESFHSQPHILETKGWFSTSDSSSIQ